MECIYCDSKPCICDFPEKLENVKVLQLDTPNKNGRVYSTETVKHALKNLPKSVKFGTVGMPGSATTPVDIGRISHSIDNIRIDGDWLVCDVRPLDTLYGKILKQLYNSNVGGFRTAGTCNSVDDNVVNGFILTGIHYVDDPA